MTDPHLIYTGTKARECAYARSHIGQIDNKYCQKCIDQNLWLPLGAYLYCLKHFPDDYIVATARYLVKQGKRFTHDGDIIEVPRNEQTIKG